MKAEHKKECYIGGGCRHTWSLAFRRLVLAVGYITSDRKRLRLFKLCRQTGEVCVWLYRVGFGVKWFAW